MGNEVQVISNTIEDIREMVEDSVAFQAEVSPIYKKLSQRILDTLNTEEELAAMEHKDLLKLLDLSNKAQLAPIEQLTKLIQSVQSLHERSELQSKIDNLTEVVDEMQKAKDDAQGDVIDATDLDDIESA